MISLVRGLFIISKGIGAAATRLDVIATEMASKIAAFGVEKSKEEGLV